MPTYVYRCSDGHEVEVQQGINDEPLQACPRVNVLSDESDVHWAACDAPCERVPQRGFFKISGAGVHSPGFK